MSQEDLIFAPFSSWHPQVKWLKYKNRKHVAFLRTMHWEKLRYLFYILPFMTHFHELLSFRDLYLAFWGFLFLKISCTWSVFFSHVPFFLIKLLGSLFQECDVVLYNFHEFCVFKMFFLFSFITYKFYSFLKRFLLQMSLISLSAENCKDL